MLPPDVCSRLHSSNCSTFQPSRPRSLASLSTRAALASLSTAAYWASCDDTLPELHHHLPHTAGALHLPCPVPTGRPHRRRGARQQRFHRLFLDFPRRRLPPPPLNSASDDPSPPTSIGWQQHASHFTGACQSQALNPRLEKASQAMPTIPSSPQPISPRPSFGHSFYDASACLSACPAAPAGVIAPWTPLGITARPALGQDCCAAAPARSNEPSPPSAERLQPGLPPTPGWLTSTSPLTASTTADWKLSLPAYRPGGRCSSTALAAHLASKAPSKEPPSTRSDPQRALLSGALPEQSLPSRRLQHRTLERGINRIPPAPGSVPRSHNPGALLRRWAAILTHAALSLSAFSLTGTHPPSPQRGCHPLHSEISQTLPLPPRRDPPPPKSSGARKHHPKHTWRLVSTNVLYT